jgi:predicted nuclease of predicted toxin-antitoxin system
MKIKLDENLSIFLKDALSGLGHDASTASEEGLLSQSDVKVAARSRREGRMVFTLDLDFSDMRKYPPGAHPGIILFRPASMGPLAVNRLVERFVRNNDLDDFSGCLAIVSEERIRVRRPGNR